jgi:uncharacterized membrane protein
MTFPQPLLASILPAPTDFLTVGRLMGSEITLKVGPWYSTGFLIAGPVLVVAAVVLVLTMYQRVKYFAMEYGYGTGWGRIKAIFQYIVLGALLVAAGAAILLMGWANQGYSVVLSPSGLTEMHREGTQLYAWTDLKGSSERIKSTDFWLRFEKGGRACRVRFLQEYWGEELQDKAIDITETSMRSRPSL